MKERRIGLRVSQETYEKLRTFCQREGKSINGAVRVFIEGAVKGAGGQRAAA